MIGLVNVININHHQNITLLMKYVHIMINGLFKLYNYITILYQKYYLMIMIEYHQHYLYKIK